MEKAIGVVNYGMGNTGSILNALKTIDCNAFLADKVKELESCDGIILPGVGAFGQAMENLQALGLIEVIKEKAQEKTPMLGICLGMQLLTDSSEEEGVHKGLGLIRGKIERLRKGINNRIPHIGWNNLEAVKSSSLYRDMSEELSFYFVHSFAYEGDEAYISAYVDAGYSKKTVASIEDGNIFGVQFHPEKSQGDGLVLLNNFASIVRGDG